MRGEGRAGTVWVDERSVRERMAGWKGERERETDRLWFWGYWRLTGGYLPAFISKLVVSFVGRWIDRSFE